MSKREANLAAQAALIPLFGGHEKKPRLLDRDVLTVGRARGCDIILEAPDVSTLHCVFYRTQEGYRLRDCGSRTGSRINGGAVRNQVLCDEDVLHIGPFSFQVHLPDRRGVKGTRKPDREHLEKSRANLVQLALELRHRCRDLIKGQAGGDRADLRRREAELKTRIRSYDQRANQMEQAERELDQERTQLLKQKDDIEARSQAVERDIAQRLEETDVAIHERWQEFQARCQTEDQRLNDWSNRLQQEEEHQREEAMQTRVQSPQEQAEMDLIFERQRQVLADAEAGLREQRVELGRMMADLRQMQQAVRNQQQVDAPALAKENEQLRQSTADWQQKAVLLETRVVELEEQPAASTAAPAADQELLAQAELLDTLKCQLTELETVRDLVGPLRKENDQAKKWLAEKDRMLAERDKQIAELQRKIQNTTSPSHAVIDLETYETELNQYRQQLENDRSRLNKEMDALRLRNEELDEATREMEMELSRERAELARERIRLDRLREEVRSETERTQRDAGVRESLAPVQKLRDELNQKKGMAPDPRLNDRLRNMRGQLQE